MRHFLAGLVERARGTTPRVEPIIAPRFAPASAAEAAPETEAATKSNGEKMPAPPDKPAALPIAAREAEPAPPRGDATEPPIEVVQETLLVPSGNPEMPLVVRQRETDMETGEVQVGRNSVGPEAAARLPSRARSEAPRPGSPPPATTRRQASRGIERAVLRPLSLPVRPPPPISPDDQPAEPPIVKVTIGRIEVRATPAPAAPSRQTAPSSGPKLTLDAYLKSRREGAR